MSNSKTATHFKVIQKFDVEYASNTITQYESTRTGMRVVVVDDKGPRINGRIGFATEIFDDSGAPHTLEHLLFCGSKNYQYRGMLDKFAARANSRTNAYTWAYKTEYIVKTAGWEGFAQFLPIYLEHLLLPTLTDAACFTEVYHVDDAGKEAGVVFSEMQGSENDKGELMWLQGKRLMYPEGSGFRSETGGLMENLRVLTADRIRAYHKEMYKPKNMCVAVTGEVNHEELLRTLDDFESTILDSVPAFDAPFQRPWTESTPTPPLAESVIARVEFPSEDESTGDVMVLYLGPKYDDHLAKAALVVMFLYLNDSSASVLDNTLIEKEELGSGISCFVDDLSTVEMGFVVSSVATEKLASVEQRLLELLKEIASKPLDMAHVLDCVKLRRRRILLKAENSSNFYKAAITADHVFGRRDGTDLKQLATLEDLDTLKGWREERWRDFLSQWIADAKHATILGVPSNALSEKNKADDEARIETRKAELGEKGLQALADKMKAVKAENERPIPPSLWDNFSVPSVETVNFISTTTARAGKAQAMGRVENDIQILVDKDDDKSPLFIHFEHFPSNFVALDIEMCTGSVPVELKPLLSLYLDNFFSTPVNRSGKRMEFEDVIFGLQKDTVSHIASVDGANGEILAIHLQTEPENYDKAIYWLKTLLFNAIHDPKRLKASLAKILADMPDEKRDGDMMADDIDVMVRYRPESSVRAQRTLARAIYLKKMKRLLESDPEEVLGRFTKLCEILHRPENFRIYVAGDITRIDHPVSSWTSLISGSEYDGTKDLDPIDDGLALLSEVGRNPGSSACIVPMASIDTSFGLVTAKAPDYYGHPDTPALYVAVTLMNAVEGPLWTAVRGPGIAYGISFRRLTATGTLMLSIYKATDSYKAFTACKEQVDGIVSGEIPITKFALEGAVSEIVLKMADEEPTYSRAAALSFTNQVIRGVTKDHNKQLLLKAQAVTAEEIRAVVQKYMVPVFQPHSSTVVITCAQTMKDGLYKRFADFGYQAEVKRLSDFEDGYGEELAADAPEDSPDDDEDSEEVDSEDSEEVDVEDGGTKDDPVASPKPSAMKRKIDLVDTQMEGVVVMRRDE